MENDRGLLLRESFCLSCKFRLEALCDDAGQTKTVAVESALAAYFDYYEKTKMCLKNNEETILPKGDQL